MNISLQRTFINIVGVSSESNECDKNSCCAKILVLMWIPWYYKSLDSKPIDIIPLFSGYQAHSGLSSSISVPTTVHLGGWQEVEEDEEDDQEINSGSTPKQGTGGSCWSAFCHKVYALISMLCGSVFLGIVCPEATKPWSFLFFFFVFLFSFVLFFSVYILLSSTKVVALDDLHGEFSMDL